MSGTLATSEACGYTASEQLAFKLPTSVHAEGR